MKNNTHPTALERLLEEARDIELDAPWLDTETVQLVRRLVRIATEQSVALSYIANSIPGPEQLFELENKRMAQAGLDAVNRIAEGGEG